MNKIIKSFLIVWLLMFSKASFSQKKNSNLFENLRKTEYLLKMRPPEKREIPGFYSPTLSTTLLSSISADLYARNLGIFCRNELKLDKITPLPFRFRLGSLEYVDWLEGKPNSSHQQELSAQQLKFSLPSLRSALPSTTN